jgi:hypothetical protein
MLVVLCALPSPWAYAAHTPPPHPTVTERGLVESFGELHAMSRERLLHGQLNISAWELALTLFNQTAFTPDG